MALVLSRLGFPPIGRHRRFVTAIAIDAVGSGVWMPVSMLYFVAVTPLSLVQVGAAMSIASLLTLPLILAAGSLVDRYGAKRILQGGNLVQAVAFAAYPFSHDMVSVTVVVALATGGRMAFWAAYPPIIVGISERGEREKWFGLLGALRNAGFAVGGLLAGIAMTIGTTAGYQAVVVLNAISFVLAFALMVGVVVREQTTAAQKRELRGSWRTVVADRGYRWLLGVNLGYALMCMVLNIAIPVYVVHMLGLPGWVSGAFFVINTVMIGAGQGLVVQAMTGRIRSRIVMLAAGFAVASYLMLLGARSVGEVVAIAVVLVAAVVYTFGELTAGPVISTLAAESPPPHLLGRFTSVYQLTWNLSSTIAPVLYAWLLGYGAAPAWLGIAVITGLGAACCLPMHRLLPLASYPVTNEAVGDEPLVDVDTSAATASVDPS